MDISKLKDLFGLGDDTAEDLETAIEKQILPDLPRGQSASDRLRAEGAKECLCQERVGTNAENLPDRCQLMKVGRCPSCGDQIVAEAEQPCAWCNTPCRPETDGFHLVLVALGAFQERHCFCSDDCFEAFRRMYPARVHRNCYERSCRDCTYCIKRYTDESEGFPGQDSVSRTRTTGTPEKD